MPGRAEGSWSAPGTGGEALAGGSVLIDRPAEAVARLTFNRPDKRNPLDHVMLDAVAEALPELAGDVRCLVITGAGEWFSAGYDIAGFSDAGFEAEAEALVAHPYHAAFAALDAFPWPVVAAINGGCLGGGLELSLCCDLRIAHSGARVGMPVGKLGLIYSHTGVQRFLDIVGPARTREIFLTSRAIGADRAEQIGLVHESVADGFADRVRDVTAELVAAAPLSVRGNKRLIGALQNPEPIPPALEAELVALRRSCFVSRDFREGVEAFRDKRRASWEGR
ncbi:MAG: enoyl-CoA hydratase/isomerase family protein [Solirubrobacterales bacterium]